MKFIKKYKNILFYLLSLFLLIFILTILNLITTFNEQVYDIIALISILITTTIFGFKTSPKKDERGIITGLKLSLIIAIIFYLIGLPFLLYKYPLKRLLYTIIISFSFIFGCILGKNQKTS